MTITAHGYTFDPDRRIDPGALPATLAYRGNRAMGLFLMVFAVVWLGAVLLIGKALYAEPFPVSYLPLVFVIPAGGLFLVGLRGLLMRIDITVDRDAVTVAERRWFATERHVVPLADYPGVLRQKVTYSRNKTTHVAWLAVLPHARRACRVVLAATGDAAEGRRLVESYARWLVKPALEEGAGGFVARAPDDLDTPLGRLAAAGKVTSSYRPGQAPPAEVRVEQHPDRIVVSLLKGPLPLWLAALFAGGGAAVAFVFIGLGADTGTQVIGGGLGLVVLAGVLWAAFGSLKTTRQIVLTRDRLALATLARGAAEPKIVTDMANDEIEAIRIARGALWFDTDRGSFQTGSNMPLAALDYVRDLIVAALATAGDAAAEEGKR